MKININKNLIYWSSKNEPKTDDRGTIMARV